MTLTSAIWPVTDLLRVGYQYSYDDNVSLGEFSGLLALGYLPLPLEGYLSIKPISAMIETQCC